MKDDKINIRVEPKIKEALMKVAKANKRELSDYVRLLYQYAIDNNLKF